MKSHYNLMLILVIHWVRYLQLGFEVFEAENGQEGLQLAQERQPNLILMDRQMPTMDGLSAVRQLRQMPQLQGLPIIGVSASVSAEDQAQSRAAGYNAFLPKPIHWPRLAAMLAEYLDIEWIYEEKETAPAVPTTLTPPPAEEMEILHQLALIGDLHAIRQRAIQLQTEESSAAFGLKLQQLAENFKERQILILIQQHLTENNP